MRNVTLTTVFVLAVLAIGGYLYLEQPFDPHRNTIEERSEQFMEDIQFKDFNASAQYHHKLERQRVDIGRAIEELFKIDPELLDIIDYRITRTEIDSTGTRGRVLVNTRFRPLKPEAVSDEQDGDVEEADLQLYWMYRHPDCPLGSECADDEICRDDADQPALRDGEDGEDGEPFECDPTREREWFMNLDSTLEQRDYQ